LDNQQGIAMRNWVGMILMTVLTSGMAHGQAQMTVTGQASVMTTPDIATVTLGVTSQMSSAGQAMAANKAALTAVLSQLTAAGIAPSDLQTSQLQLNPMWRNDQNDAASVISGYVASNMVRVLVRDLDKMGTVLDAAVATGANTLNGLEFALSDPRPAQDAARTATVQDAMARAKVLAKAAGVTLGPVVTISENADFGMPMMKSMASEATPIAAGEIAVTASVIMVFELR
jgi:uncharacterized protein